VGNGSGTVTNSFWDEDMTGQEVSAGGVGKTTEQMMSAGTYSGWDFGSNWVLDEGGSYAHMKWRYEDGVRGIWGKVLDETGTDPLTPDKVIGLYVSPTEGGEAGDPLMTTKTGASSMYYFVMGNDDARIQPTDYVVGGLMDPDYSGNTRMPAETGSIKDLDIWGHLTRVIPHPQDPIIFIDVNKVIQDKLNPALNNATPPDINQMRPMAGDVGKAPAPVVIVDETSSVPMDWPEMGGLDMEISPQAKVSRPDGPEAGQEPVPVFSSTSDGDGMKSLRDESVENIVDEAVDDTVRAAGAGKTSESQSSKSVSSEQKGEGTAEPTSGDSASGNNESKSEGEVSPASESQTGDSQAKASEASAEETAAAVEGESTGSEAASDDSAASSDKTQEPSLEKPVAPDGNLRPGFFISDESKNLLTDVRVVEGAVYVIDGVNSMSLLDRGESLRVMFKDRAASAEVQPLPAVKSDPVMPVVKDDLSASSAKVEVSPSVDLPVNAAPSSPSLAVAKTETLDSALPSAPADVVALALSSVKASPGTDARYGTLKNPDKDVFVKCQGGEWQAAKDGMVILPGDEVRTASRSSVEVLIDSGKIGRVEIKEGSLFRINKAETDALTGAKTTLLELALGKILVKVEPLHGNSRFEVKTPTSISGVRGTIFEVTVKEKA